MPALRLAPRDQQRVRVARHLLERAEQVRARELARGGARARPGAAGLRADDLLVADRAAIGHRQAAHLPRRLLVGESLAEDRRRRLGVVLRAEVLPDTPAGLRAEALLELLEDEGRGQLAAAALAEDAGDERGDRDHVG